MVRASWIVAGGVVLAAACSKESEPQDPGGGGNTPLERVEAALVGEFCDALIRCAVYGSDAERIRAAQFGDACESLAHLGLFTENGAAIEAGRIELDPTQITACLAEFDDCEDLTSVDVRCPELFVGQQEVGEVCRRNAECVDDTFCDAEPGCVGVCAAGRGVGGSCADNPNACGADAICTATPEGGVICSAYEGGNIGDTCALEGADTCNQGLACSSETGLCELLGAAGASCSGTLRCQNGYTCNSSSGLCEAIHQLGEECGATRGRNGGCDPSLFCDETNRCAAHRVAREACRTSDACDSGLICVPMDNTEGSPKICGDLQVSTQVNARCLISSFEAIGSMRICDPAAQLACIADRCAEVQYTGELDSQCDDEFFPCNEGLSCARTGAGNFGTCLELKADGASCEADYECEGGACMAGDGGMVCGVDAC